MKSTTKTDQIPFEQLIHIAPREHLKKWLKELKYFNVVTTPGGLLYDGSRFETWISYVDVKDLVYKLKKLGVEIDTNGIPLDSKEIESFTMIRKRLQPRQYLDGCLVFVSITGVIEFSVSGTKDENFYEVSEEDFKVCRKVEALFDQLNWQRFKSNEIKESKYCISSSRYAYLLETYPEIIPVKDTPTSPEKKLSWWRKWFN